MRPSPPRWPSPSRRSERVPVYASDPHAALDDEFEPGALSHLVAGNRGRLLDARRTPIVVRHALIATGTFTVEIAAFEDAGAIWEIVAEEVDRFQFAPGQPAATDETIAALEDAVQRFDRPLSIPATEADRLATDSLIAAGRLHARAFLPGVSPVDAFEAYLDEYGLREPDDAFAAQYVSNARSGELVKGHEIVMARMGLRAYEGTVVRSPDLFAGAWTEERRRQHIVARLAFLRELYALEGLDRVTLYRGLASDRPLEPPRPRSLVSATFDLAVAEAHFTGGPTTVSAALHRQSVPVERLFMTHRETRAMNRHFRESEAVLLADPASPFF